MNTDSRAQETEDRRFDAGLETYANKKYGPYWEECFDPQDVADEFAAWLESKSQTSNKRS